jgi:hypothetical protein
MFLMGVSVALSVQSQLRRAVPRKVLLLRIFKRSLILFGLGLCLNSGSRCDLK